MNQMNRHILMNKPDERHLDQAHRKTTSQCLGACLSGSFISRSKTQLNGKRAQTACQKQWIVLEYTHFFSIYSQMAARTRKAGVLQQCCSLTWDEQYLEIYRFTEPAADISVSQRRKCIFCLVRYLKAIHNVLQTLHIKEIHLQATLTAPMRDKVLPDILKSPL